MIVVFVGFVKFIILGKTFTSSEDARVVIDLNHEEKIFIENRMSLFLDSLKQALTDISNKDLINARKKVRAVEYPAISTLPWRTRAKLPIEFKKMAVNIHVELRKIIVDMKAIEDVDYSIGQIAKLMDSCVQCHKMYRISR